MFFLHSLLGMFAVYRAAVRTKSHSRVPSTGTQASCTSNRFVNRRASLNTEPYWFWIKLWAGQQPDTHVKQYTHLSSPHCSWCTIYNINSFNFQPVQTCNQNNVPKINIQRICLLTHHQLNSNIHVWNMARTCRASFSIISSPISMITFA